MDEGKMVYVAADPTQPGAAWAACVDNPRWANETAKDVASWVRNGATVMRVTPEVAREMNLTPLTVWPMRCGDFTVSLSGKRISQPPPPTRSRTPGTG